MQSHLYNKGWSCTQKVCFNTCCSYTVSLTNLLATCDEYKWPHVSWNLTSASALHLPSSNLSEDPVFYSFLLLSYVSLPISSQAPLCLLTFVLPLFLSVLSVECYHPSLSTFLHAPSCLTFLFTWSFLFIPLLWKEEFAISLPSEVFDGCTCNLQQLLWITPLVICSCDIVPSFPLVVMIQWHCEKSVTNCILWRSLENKKRNYLMWCAHSWYCITFL